MSENSIKSPLPGTFYHRSSPDVEPYKVVGDMVSVGDVIGLVEVMKSFMEVKADVSGTVVSYEIENEQPVQAGQILLVLKD